jgi:hypothetical protein
MTNPFIHYEVAPSNSYQQFNAFESAAPCALSEYPTIVQDARSSNGALMQFDANQNQPFEITDTSGRVFASSCPGGCPCPEYTARGWNRGGQRGNYSGGDGSGSCGPSDGGCGPSDGGGCDSGRGGLMRGLLGRFGRGGLMSRLFGGGGCGGGCGGCLGFARGFRR